MGEIKAGGMDEAPKRNLDGITPTRSVDAVVRPAATPVEAATPVDMTPPVESPPAAVPEPVLPAQPITPIITPVSPPAEPTMPVAKPSFGKRFLKFLLTLIVIAALAVGAWFLYQHFYLK